MSGSPVASSDSAGKDEDVVLRLGDVLRLIPLPFLKPGAHDRMRPIRLSVDELAKQIASGRVSIPLSRLAAACPEIFEAPDAIPAEEQIALPLQRLLDQIGLVAQRSPLQNNIPKAQVEQAREEAGRILTAAGADAEAKREPPGEPIHPFAVAKALSAAKQFLGFFGRQSEGPAALEDVAEKPAAAPVLKPESKPEPVSESKPEPETPPPDGFVSLRLRPIFQLLPMEVSTQPGFTPPPEARGMFPLSLLDPQLAAGHVEVPVEELVKALPEELRGYIRPVAGVQVWIPLDEIFQSLPPTHLYYMPPLDDDAVLPPESVAAEGTPSPAEVEESVSEKTDAPAPTQPLADDAPERDTEEDAPNPAEAAVKPPAAEAPTKREDPPSEESEPVPEPLATSKPEPVSKLEVASNPEPVPISELEASEPAPAEVSTPAGQPATTPRAPWMRGFMVPPPLLSPGSESSPASALETLPESPAPQTPEARQTSDFLAGQPGIFAAAAFVEGAIFASADFPRKPDLETLRDFIGAFVEKSQESAQRLGWTGMLTLACEQFFVTAAVRDRFFLVALHHDRVLPPVSHEALLGAADGFGKAGSKSGDTSPEH